MELKLENGDYIPDGLGGMVRLESDQALLQRVLFRLSARRGGLPFLPDLGSRLYQLGREPLAARSAAARQYVVEALAGEPVTVEDVILQDRGGGRIDVTAVLRCEDQQLQVTVTV